MILNKSLLRFLAILLLARAARADDIIGGPIIGHVTDHSARIWVELSVAKKVTVSAYGPDSRGPDSQISVDVDGPTPFVADVPLNNLRPNANYRIQLSLDDKPVTLPPGYPDLLVRTMPPQGQEAPFTIGLGSCLTGSSANTANVFKQVMNAGPRAFFFLGNSGYLPAKPEQYPEKLRAAFRMICDMHESIRRDPALQPLFRTTPSYAVWGEHDFGDDGSDKTFPFAGESLAAFQHFYPNPDWGTPAIPACFFSMSIGDADFFCLDDRMYRDPLPPASPPAAAGAARSMLGDKQLDWLKQSLTASRAKFKVIAAGDPLLAQEPESWSNFQPEQQDFLQWLKNQHVAGVIFMSGGKVGELSVLKRDGTYPLVEITSGPLADNAPVGPEPANPLRAGEAVGGANFGTMEFGGKDVDRFVMFRLRDATGKIRLEQTINAAQLR